MDKNELAQELITLARGLTAREKAAGFGMLNDLQADVGKIDREVLIVNKGLGSAISWLEAMQRKDDFGEIAGVLKLLEETLETSRKITN